MLLALFFLQLRWTVGWLLFDGPDVFAAILVGLIFTPLLLFTLALMEGRRNGVIIGLLVAANMGLAVIFGSQRESLAAMYMADPRLGFPTFVVMLMYAVFVSLWSSQQDQIRDAELRVSLLAEQGNCDVATGLLNRRGLQLVARGWLNRNQDFGVLLVQQDRYEALEAVWSDAELQANMVGLAKGIEANFRASITIARWTEGTLMLLSHHADRVLVEKMSQELRRAIDAIGYAEGDGPGPICIGYTLASPTDTFDEAAARAEIALQTALDNGNCVRAHLLGA
jgi:GGDEF domain-containing protein